MTSNTPPILQLDKIDHSHVSIAGGKAANLGELLKNDFPVPPGFVVTAQVYAEISRRLALQRDIDALINAPEIQHDVKREVIYNKIITSVIPDELTDLIYSAFDDFQVANGSAYVAIRSSATLEDSALTSFAGQHATYYHITRNRLLKMILYCFASLWSKEAVSYRFMHGINHDEIEMAVIVQEMIDADISGICFTKNPVSGALDDIVVEATWGLGACIVDGRVTPDQFVLDRKELSLRETRLAHKKFMVHIDPDERNHRLKEVAQHYQRRITLSKKQVTKIAQLALLAEEIMGCPQDMEFTILHNHLLILQSRPITESRAIIVGQDVTEKLVLFKPLLENFTEPITPLTADLLGTETPPGVRLVDGWVYVDLAHIRPIFPFKVTDEELANIFYDGRAELPHMTLSFFRSFIMAGFIVCAYLAGGTFLARTRDLPDDFMNTFKMLCRRIEHDQAYGISETLSRLWAWSWMKFFDPIGNMPVLVNITTLRYMFIMGIMRKLLKRWVPDLADTVEHLCAGSDGILSADMGRDIFTLARYVRSVETVLRIFREYNPEAILETLDRTPEASNFLFHFHRFLATYGHRGIREVELKNPRWVEDPTPLLGMIKNYIDNDFDPDVHEHNNHNRRVSVTAQIQNALATNGIGKWFQLRFILLKWLAKRSKYFIKLRENTRFYHIMGLSVVRQKILETEKELLGKGKLKCKDDIFFLSAAEIELLRTNQAAYNAMENRIRDRRLRHIRLSKMIPPKTFNIDTPQRDHTAAAARPDRLHMLCGQPASPGVYEGSARVILDPAVNVELIPGEVLVAPYTDPAWTPLFLTAGAAVVEVGSYMSHAGTVAREFGMPCVVDVPECTTRIQTGDILHVDGDSGKVLMSKGKRV